MAKLENKLGVNVKVLDSGVDPKDVEQAHKTLSNLQGTPIHSILKSKMPEIHVVGTSFPKVGYKDYHIDPAQNKVIIWHPAGDKVPVEKKIHDSLSRSALASIITKVTNSGGSPAATQVQTNSNENKPISGDQLEKRQKTAESTKDKMKKGIQQSLIEASKNMWENREHLPPAIKRRMTKNPKGGVSPQTLSLLHKLIGKRMTERSGDTMLIINKAARAAKTPEGKKMYEGMKNLVNRVLSWGHRI